MKGHASDGRFKGETLAVKGSADNIPEVVLEVIRQTYNIYAEKLNNKEKWTVSMSQYCNDVGFLLSLVYELNRRVKESEKK